MDEQMGRRTVGGLLLTKGGSILLFREDGSNHKANSCCSRHGCSSRHSADRAKGKEPHRAAVPSGSTTPAAARRSQIFKNPKRKPPPPQPHESSASDSVSSRDGAGSSVGSQTGNRSRDNPGRDLLTRLKERVNASRKRSSSQTGENRSSSSSNDLSASSASPPSSRNISRPSQRAASRTRRADQGPRDAGSDRARTRDARRNNSERSDDDLLLAEQMIARERESAAEGFLSGFRARYRSGLQGALASLEDTMEDSNEYWRFDMGGTEELENYFIFNDRHRGMRMDIDSMSYEELLALGEQMGTVNTGLAEDALFKCLKRSPYMPTASGSHEDSDRRCSICQEEYMAGEEVGKMACKHSYHFSCIQHWLRLKNWCPICKSVARNTN